MKQMLLWGGGTFQARRQLLKAQLAKKIEQLEAALSLAFGVWLP